MKIALIVQRYGKDISGGAEEHARQLAEHLGASHAVEILSTCSLNYDTWSNELPPGLDKVNDIPVRRFPTDFPKDKNSFDPMTDFLVHNRHSYIEEMEWLVHQGPYSEKLFRYLQDSHQDYDLLIFYTYLYITTVLGLTAAPHKSLVVPTAHDEPMISFSVFKNVFHLPRGILYLTEEEQDFVQHTFRNVYIPHTVLGFGIDQPGQSDIVAFRKKYDLNMPFLLYIGRVDQGKGCGELIDFFQRFRVDEANPTLKLFLAGKKHMPGSDDAHIIMPGYISDDEKAAALAAAELIISPSWFESLSILVLDAFNFGKPVLANARSAVVRGHCQKSGAGFVYHNYEEFRSNLKKIIGDHELQRQCGIRASHYVDENFRWDRVMKEFDAFVSCLLPG